MTSSQVADFIVTYAARIGAPIRTGVAVTSVVASDDGYRVETDRGAWRCRALVLASGAHGLPNVPACAATVPGHRADPDNETVSAPASSMSARCSSSARPRPGLQLADEIARSGREVTLCVASTSGCHVPIAAWTSSAGSICLACSTSVTTRSTTSSCATGALPQLIGTPERTTLDLNALTGRGVNLVGRLVGIEAGRALFSGSLQNHCAMADLKLGRLLDWTDRWLEEHPDHPAASAAGSPSADRPHVSHQHASRLTTADARPGQIPHRHGHLGRGLPPRFSLAASTRIRRKGRLRHDGGIVDAPGLYVLGLNFMRRRKSSFIHGAEDDTRDLSEHLAGFLRSSARSSPRLAAG
jgi:putative flavoprotein involved in K+ transport